LDHWNISPVSNTGMCLAITSQPNSQRAFGVLYDARQQRMYLTLTRDHVGSVKQDDIRPMDVAFFEQLGADSKTIGGLNFTVSKHGESTATFFSDAIAPNQIELLAKSVGIVFATGDRIVASFDLHESAVAVAMLKHCATVAAGQDPADPFVGQ
ncbi:MAG TPA: hypothetical protein VFY95_04665, partial [Sphingomicrobium sp.]